MPKRYPWDRWLARKRIKLNKGSDFFCQVHCMGVQASRAAKALGIPVRVHVEIDHIIVTRKEVA